MYYYSVMNNEEFLNRNLEKKIIKFKLLYLVNI
jgi:hypothetical protein